MKRDAVRMADSDLDQLLARGRLSGVEYDRIEERVLERVRPEQPKRWWFALFPATAAASLLGVWLVGSGGKVPEPFTAKSGGNAVRTVIDVGCEGPRPHVCRLGQTLMFSVGANGERGFLAAYAERVGEPTAERIWYFSASGLSPRIEPATETRVLGEGVRLGPPHAPGHYRVRVWISKNPVERTDQDLDRRAGPAEISLEIVE